MFQVLNVMMGKEGTGHEIKDTDSLKSKDIFVTSSIKQVCHLQHVEILDLKGKTEQLKYRCQLMTNKRRKFP